MKTTGGRRGGAPVATQPELEPTATGAPARDGGIRVVVVDDHEMFAESIARALDRADEIRVVAIARSHAEGATVIATHRPDIAVVDYQLPDGDGAQLAASIRDISPASRVIILTGHGEDRIALAALEAGAAGFLTKDKAVDELVLAVRNVHAGESYIPPAMLAGLLPRLRTTFKAVGSELTQREREVVQLLADGLSNDAIAATPGAQQAHRAQPRAERALQARRPLQARSGGDRRARGPRPTRAVRAFRPAAPVEPSRCC